MQVRLTGSELWMAALHTQAQDPLPTWVDVELRRLASRTSLDLRLSKPSEKGLIPGEKPGQQETDVETHLTGWKLHALTLGYAPLLCPPLYAPVFTLQQLVPEPTSFGYRVHSSQHCTYLDHG